MHSGCKISHLSPTGCSVRARFYTCLPCAPVGSSTCLPLFSLVSSMLWPHNSTLVFHLSPFCPKTLWVLWPHLHLSTTYLSCLQCFQCTLALPPASNALGRMILRLAPKQVLAVSGLVFVGWCAYRMFLHLCRLEYLLVSHHVTLVCLPSCFTCVSLLVSLPVSPHKFMVG